MPCDTCGSNYVMAYDRDDFPDIYCRYERSCEELGCKVVNQCGDDRPEPCDLCSLNYCPDHLHKFGDADLCLSCMREVEDNRRSPW